MLQEKVRTFLIASLRNLKILFYGLMIIVLACLDYFLYLQYSVSFKYNLTFGLFSNNNIKTDIYHNQFIKFYVNFVIFIVEYKFKLRVYGT